MVASYNDGRKIIDILLTYLSLEDSYLSLEDSILMMEKVWEEVGRHTDNPSLEETVILFKKFLEAEWFFQKEYPNGIDWFTHYQLKKIPCFRK